MPTTVHEFAWPDRVVVGTVGVVGARTFYLQVRSGSLMVSVALEKQQSAVLAEKIDEILDQLITLEGNPFSVPTSTAVELVDDDPLETVSEQFRTGAMSLGWDPRTAQIVLEAHPVAAGDAENDEPLDDDEGSELLVVRMPVGTARAFAKRAREVVAAGRPVCPLCGYPLEAAGHVCTLPEL